MLFTDEDRLVAEYDKAKEAHAASVRILDLLRDNARDHRRQLYAAEEALRNHLDKKYFKKGL